MSVAQEQIEGMVKDLVSRTLLGTGKALSGRVETQVEVLSFRTYTAVMVMEE